MLWFEMHFLQYFCLDHDKTLKNQFFLIPYKENIIKTFAYVVDIFLKKKYPNYFLFMIILYAIIYNWVSNL